MKSIKKTKGVPLANLYILLILTYLKILKYDGLTLGIICSFRILYIYIYVGLEINV